MMSKYHIKLQWVTEDGAVHSTEEGAKLRQFLLEATRDAGYGVSTAPAQNLIADLATLISAGWMLTAPATCQESQFPI